MTGPGPPRAVRVGGPPPMRCENHFKSWFGNVKAFNLKKLKLSPTEPVAAMAAGGPAAEGRRQARPSLDLKTVLPADSGRTPAELAYAEDAVKLRPLTAQPFRKFPKHKLELRTTTTGPVPLARRRLRGNR